MLEHVRAQFAQGGHEPGVVGVHVIESAQLLLRGPLLLETVVDHLLTLLQQTAGCRVDHFLLGGLVDGQQADESAECLRPVVGGGVLDLGEEITDVVVLLLQQCHDIVVLAGVVEVGHGVGQGSLLGVRFRSGVGPQTAVT